MTYWVVDANIAVNTVLSMSNSLNLFWKRADQEQITPCAPRLWMSETTSAVRFLLSEKYITSDEAEAALRTIHGLRVEIINEDEELCLRALELAGKIGQKRACDSVYLALAEKLVADFWTADEKLANRCHKDLKLSWVNFVGK